MIREFVDREEERSILEREWDSPGGRLIVLYGRRRVGKTRLIGEFIRNKPGILYIADDTSSHSQVTQFKSRCARFFDDPLLDSLDIKNWEQIFQYLAQKKPDQRSYLVIDEFSYLVKNDPSLLSTLQKAWDSSFASSNWCLVLSGSILSLMSEAALASTSPLYGRRTRDMLLGPLRFPDSDRFFRMPAGESLKVYLAIGGIPEYLLKVGSYPNALSFFRDEFFNRYGYFYHEPYFILSQEFRELRIYQSVLHAMSQGNTTPATIGQFCGMDSRHLYPYIESMTRLGFIERESPLLGNPRQGIYHIRDRIFDFWYRFVFSYRQEIETGHFDIASIDLHPFFGRQFECFVREEFAWRVLPGYRFGHWWYKGDEIDVLGVDDTSSRVLFGECKWGSLRYSEACEILGRLETKSLLVRSDSYTNRHFCLFCAGEVEDKGRLRREGYLVFDSADIEEYCHQDHLQPS